ncbi:MAG: zf-HC2 domain-containing protein [Planctomycetes bacterium]|nr:zf-HC2 domain-containing protein [Planctomycetota bacterium]
MNSLPESFDESLLTAYLDGELSPTDAASVQAALAESPALQQMLLELTRVRELLARLKQSSPASERSYIHGPWNDDGVLLRPTTEKQSSWWNSPSPLANLAASLLIFLSFGMIAWWSFAPFRPIAMETESFSESARRPSVAPAAQPGNQASIDASVPGSASAPGAFDAPVPSAFIESATRETTAALSAQPESHSNKVSSDLTLAEKADSNSPSMLENRFVAFLNQQFSKKGLSPRVDEGDRELNAKRIDPGPVESGASGAFIPFPVEILSASSSTQPAVAPATPDESRRSRSQSVSSQSQQNDKASDISHFYVFQNRLPESNGKSSEASNGVIDGFARNLIQEFQTDGTRKQVAGANPGGRVPERFAPAFASEGRPYVLLLVSDSDWPAIVLKLRELGFPLEVDTAPRVTGFEAKWSRSETDEWTIQRFPSSPSDNLSQLLAKDETKQPAAGLAAPRSFGSKAQNLSESEANSKEIAFRRIVVLLQKEPPK